MTMKWLAKLRRKQIIGAAIFLVLLAGGWYWYSGAAQKPEDSAVRPITVTRANIEEVVTSQGKLEAKQYVDVGTQVSGQLKNIHVDIGDTVKKRPTARRNRPARLSGSGGSG